MPFNVYERWPEFQFKNRKAVPAGLQWSVYMTDPSGVILVCVGAVQGKSSTWTIPGYDAGTPRDLGVFKKRELAATAYLEATAWKPEREPLEAQYKADWQTNALRPAAPLTSEILDEIYGILVEECNASESTRENFLAVAKQQLSVEYRFSGGVGAGGRIHLDSLRFYVDCYEEEKVPYVNLMLARTNARLQELYLKNWGIRK